MTQQFAGRYRRLVKEADKEVSESGTTIEEQSCGAGKSTLLIEV